MLTIIHCPVCQSKLNYKSDRLYADCVDNEHLFVHSGYSVESIMIQSVPFRFDQQIESGKYTFGVVETFSRIDGVHPFVSADDSYQFFLLLKQSALFI